MNDREYGMQLQEKFELYLLGLIFTVLALAVQTAKFDNINIIAAYFELVSWVALLISGLVGLWRMELIPVTACQVGPRPSKPVLNANSTRPQFSSPNVATLSQPLETA